MKRERHEVVVDLINKYDIETQEELAAYLRKEGYEVTQATVSRDIRELHLSKIAAADRSISFFKMRITGWAISISVC